MGDRGQIITGFDTPGAGEQRPFDNPMGSFYVNTEAGAIMGAGAGAQALAGGGVQATASILPTIIDVSHWDGPIDWATTKRFIHFAVVRVQDGTVLDTRLAQNIAGCQNNGIPYYLYGFYRNGGAVEAQRMMARAKAAGATRQRGYVLDVEVSGQSTAGIKSALAALNATGLDNGVYIANNLYPEYGGTGYGEKWRWIPRYGIDDGFPHTPPSHYCDLWQFTSVGKVPGIGGNVDCNAISGKRSLASFTTERK